MPVPLPVRISPLGRSMLVLTLNACWLRCSICGVTLKPLSLLKRTALPVIVFGVAEVDELLSIRRLSRNGAAGRSLVEV